MEPDMELSEHPWMKGRMLSQDSQVSLGRSWSRAVRAAGDDSEPLTRDKRGEGKGGAHELQERAAEAET